MNPSKSKVTVLCQIAKLIPRNLVSKLANSNDAKEARTVWQLSKTER